MHLICTLMTASFVTSFWNPKDSCALYNTNPALLPFRLNPVLHIYLNHSISSDGFSCKIWCRNLYLILPAPKLTCDLCLCHLKGASFWVDLHNGRWARFGYDYYRQRERDGGEEKGPQRTLKIPTQFNSVVPQFHTTKWNLSCLVFI